MSGDSTTIQVHERWHLSISTIKNLRLPDASSRRAIEEHVISCIAADSDIAYPTFLVAKDDSPSKGISSGSPTSVADCEGTPRSKDKLQKRIYDHDPCNLRAAVPGGSVCDRRASKKPKSATT